jgi:ferredoxin--NADP+ reductase
MSDNELNAVVAKRIEVAPGLMILRVKPDGQEMQEFKPGQYGVLALPGSAPRVELSDPEEKAADPDKLIKRAYSIASSSRQGEYLELYITLIRSGQLTPRLFALNEGEKVFLAPKFKGVFTMDKAPEDANLVLIATGTGIAPYVSMIRSVFICDGDRKFAVLHGARHSWDLGYRAELSTLAAQCKNLTYIPLISKPDEEETGWTAHTGRVQSLWQNGAIEAEAGFKPDPSNTHIFLCGAPAMIEDMVDLLSKEGYKEHKKKDPGQVHVERFW